MPGWQSLSLPNISRGRGPVTHQEDCRAPTNCCLRPSTHRAILCNQTGHRESHKPPILPLSTITHLPCTGTNHNLASQAGPNLGNAFAHALNKIYMLGIAEPGIAEPGIADPAPLGLAPPRLASLCPASLTWQKEPSDGRQVHAAGQPPTCLNKLQSCSGDAKPEHFVQRAFIGTTSIEYLAGRYSHSPTGWVPFLMVEYRQSDRLTVGKTRRWSNFDRTETNSNPRNDDASAIRRGLCKRLSLDKMSNDPGRMGKCHD